MACHSPKVVRCCETSDWTQHLWVQHVETVCIRSKHCKFRKLLGLSHSYSKIDSWTPVTFRNYGTQESHGRVSWLIPPCQIWVLNRRLTAVGPTPKNRYVLQKKTPGWWYTYPFWKIWKSIGMIIPKPPTSISIPLNTEYCARFVLTGYLPR